MFRGIGFPLAQDALEIAPIESVGCGKTVGTDAIESGFEERSQIGLGKTEVTFFVPHPTSKRLLVAKNARRFTSGSKLKLDELSMRLFAKSLSSTQDMCLKKFRK